MSADTDDALLQRHLKAEEKWTMFSYSKPDEVNKGKGMVQLGRNDIVRGVVQVVKKHGGENNMHYHTDISSFWMVLKGRVRFYGPEDVVLGEFGPHEGMIKPRYSRYWFENIVDEELEILQVSAFSSEHVQKSGRTDAATQKFAVGTGERFYATKS